MARELLLSAFLVNFLLLLVQVLGG